MSGNAMADYVDKYRDERDFFYFDCPRCKAEIEVHKEANECTCSRCDARYEVEWDADVRGESFVNTSSLHRIYDICPHCDGCGKEAGHHGLSKTPCSWCKGTGQVR